ncbi:MAG TPA: YqgE/AlgH family protein [Casimicrobiaceae bacterium]|nr:YqgE/AlgH family protein [Casimicrobiaceae bacterium]
MIRTLCALLALLGMSWCLAAGDTKPLTAILLVARGELPDTNFNGSTVLVMNDIANGPFGIIVNRPTKVTVSRLFPDIKSRVHLDDKVYFGGPVEFGSLSFLFRADTSPEHAIEVLDKVYLSRDLELLRKLLERDAPKATVRIFVGYAGWEPEQLEAEITRGDWTMAHASAAAIFDAKPEREWPEPRRPEGRRS